MSEDIVFGVLVESLGEEAEAETPGCQTSSSCLYKAQTGRRRWKDTQLQTSHLALSLTHSSTPPRSPYPDNTPQP